MRHGLEHRLQLLHIVGLLGHSNGYYDLLLTHHRLGIVALHVPLPGLHDAAAEVSGPDSLTSALTPGVLALIGRELIRRGEVVFLIDTTAGKLRLLPAEGHDVAGDSTPDSWEYLLTLGGPSRTITYDYVPAASVLHFRYAVDPSTPWRGNGPVRVAALAGKLSAATAATLGDESSAPVGRLLGIPVDGADATVEGLKADIANARGKVALLETGDWDNSGDATGSPCSLRAFRSGATCVDGRAAVSGVPGSLLGVCGLNSWHCGAALRRPR